MDVREEEEFWMSLLDLSDSQLYKTQVRPLRKSSFSYPESFRHGTCSINALGVDQKAELMMAIKAFTDLYLAL